MKLSTGLEAEIKGGEGGKYIMLSRVSDAYGRTYTILTLDQRDFKKIRNLMDKIERDNIKRKAH
jgi:hypothetical protein